VKHDGGSRTAKRGPYGTNEGDKWTSPGSDMQARLDADGEGMILIHEMMVKDGELQECLYVTKLPELVEEAEAGTPLWIAAQAQAN
jgi:hypothetical protein